MEWIKLFTKFRDWKWYDDGNTKDLFLELLLTANSEDKEWHGVEVKRGQTLIGREKLSKKLGISEQSIRTSLNRLKSTNEITTKITNKFTIVTINNYDRYQKSTSKLTNNQPATNQQLTTPIDNKNINNTNTLIANNKYIKIEDVKEEDFVEIAGKYQVPVAFVKSKLDDMINWHEMKPQKNRYSNYYRALCDWVKRDSLKIKIDYAKQNSDLAL